MVETFKVQKSLLFSNSKEVSYLVYNEYKTIFFGLRGLEEELDAHLNGDMKMYVNAYIQDDIFTIINRMGEESW